MSAIRAQFDDLMDIWQGPDDDAAATVIVDIQDITDTHPDLADEARAAGFPV